MYVECGKLERVGAWAFRYCVGLGSINFPSAKIVERFALGNCPAMTQAIFGKDLESVEGRALYHCTSLESITIPLKNGLFTEDSIFKGCVNLKRVDLVEGDALRDFTDALQLESWRNEMIYVIDSINEVLHNTDPGGASYDDGGKVIAIREWIGSVLRKVTHYKAAHRELLNEAAIALQSSIPNDAVINNILPFIELPSQTAFDGEHE